LVKTLLHTRASGETQILGVGQGLAALLTLQESITSLCLMTSGDFLVRTILTGLHVASCRDDSFAQQSEATERVCTYSLAGV
jgi:hypothetical protein